MENRVAVIAAQLNAENAARTMVQEIVALGVPPEEVNSAIEHLTQEARTAAIFELGKREGKKLAGE